MKANTHRITLVQPGKISSCTADVAHIAFSSRVLHPCSRIKFIARQQTNCKHARTIPEPQQRKITHSPIYDRLAVHRKKKNGGHRSREIKNKNPPKSFAFPLKTNYVIVFALSAQVCACLIYGIERSRRSLPFPDAKITDRVCGRKL